MTVKAWNYFRLSEYLNKMPFFNLFVLVYIIESLFSFFYFYKKFIPETKHPEAIPMLRVSRGWVRWWTVNQASPEAPTITIRNAAQRGPIKIQI